MSDNEAPDSNKLRLNEQSRQDPPLPDASKIQIMSTIHDRVTNFILKQIDNQLNKFDDNLNICSNSVQNSTEYMCAPCRTPLNIQPDHSEFHHPHTCLQ